MPVSIKGKTPKVLREEAQKLLTEAQTYNQEHGDDWTSERESKFDAMLDDALTLKKAADSQDRIRELAEMRGDRNPGDGRPPEGDPGNPGEGKAKLRIRTLRQDGPGRPHYADRDAGRRGSVEYQAGWNEYVRFGKEMNPTRYANLQSDNAAQAGYLIASEQFAAGILKEVDDMLFVRRYAKVHTVPEATSLGIRRRTARANTFAWGTELQVASNDTTLAYGKKILTPHPATGSIKLSRDLVRRSMDAVSEVQSELARNAGELQEDAFLLGTGYLQALGIFTPSTNGISTSRDVQTGSATNLTLDGLIDAKFLLKGQYRRGLLGEVRWLFNRTGIKLAAKLKDDENQPIFRIGAGRQQDGGPPEDELLGFPVDESERAPGTFTTGQYVGSLQNWRYYEIADALDYELQYLDQLYAETSEIGYIARIKCDGMPTQEEAFVRLITN